MAQNQIHTAAGLSRQPWYLDVIYYRRGTVPSLAAWGVDVLRLVFSRIKVPASSIHATPGALHLKDCRPGWESGKRGMPELKRSRFSNPALVDFLERDVPSDVDVFFAGAALRGAVDKPVDVSWSMHMFQADPNLRGDGRLMSDATMVLSLNTRLLPPQSGVLTDLLQQLARLHAGWEDTMYGFVTCEGADDTSGGFLYTPCVLRPYSWALEKEEWAWWHPTTNRARCARGAYWGNYFGPALADIMRSRGVTTDLAALCTEAPLPASALSAPLEHGGLYLTLSENPLDAVGSRETATAFEQRRLGLLEVLKRHRLVPA